MASGSATSTVAVLLEEDMPSSIYPVQDAVSAPAPAKKPLAHPVESSAGVASGTAASAPEATPASTKRSTSAVALTLVSLGLATLLSALDMTIVTTAIPSIVADLHSSDGYIWVGSAFILTYTAITPVWGSVADIWGRKPVILLAVAFFLAGSLLCALAPIMNAMIAGRAVQGIGASGMGVMNNVIISDLFSLRDRGLYLAIMSVIWAVVSAIGPVLGGIMTTKLSWRWCFWINLPIGAVVFFALFFFLKVNNPHTPVWTGLKAIDWIGSAFVMGAAVMILLGLDFGDVTHPWSSATVVSLLVFGVVGLAAFLYNEWKLTRNPILPLRLFRTASTSAAFAVFATNFYVYIGLTYYLPLYAQAVLGANALTAGVYMLPLIVSCCLAAALGGVVIQQTGRYLPIMYAAQLTLTLGIGLFIDLDFESNITKLVIFEIITGVGTGLNVEAPTIAALAGTAERDSAATIAAMSFLRSMATAVSVVVGGVLFQNEMKAAGPQLTAQLGEKLARLFDGAQAAANVEMIATLAEEQQAVVRRTYFDGLRKVWIMYVAFAGLATILNLFVRAHPLRRENEEPVLGLNRHDAQQTSSEVGPGAVELRARRQSRQH